MTEGSQKKFGFVVDLNISRVLNTCVNYTIYKNDKSTEDKIKYLIENHLINIDVDMMEQKKLNSDAIVSKLMEILKSSIALLYSPISDFAIARFIKNSALLGFNSIALEYSSKAPLKSFRSNLSFPAL